MCAGIEPGQLAYVAVHGTGTPLGDPIEMTALGQAACSRYASLVPRQRTSCPGLHQS